MGNKEILSELVQEIERVVCLAEYYKNSYFWRPPVSATGRRILEQKDTTEVVKWTEGDDDYEASFTVRCSCKRIYATGRYIKNGKVTNLTAIRNSMNRIKNLIIC